MRGTFWNQEYTIKLSKNGTQVWGIAVQNSEKRTVFGEWQDDGPLRLTVMASEDELQIYHPPLAATEAFDDDEPTTGVLEEKESLALVSPAMHEKLQELEEQGVLPLGELNLEWSTQKEKDQNITGLVTSAWIMMPKSQALLLRQSQPVIVRIPEKEKREAGVVAYFHDLQDSDEVEVYSVESGGITEKVDNFESVTPQAALGRDLDLDKNTWFYVGRMPLQRSKNWLRRPANSSDPWTAIRSSDQSKIACAEATRQESVELSRGRELWYIPL